MLTICTAVRQSALRRQHGIRRMERITCMAVYRKIINMTEPAVLPLQSAVACATITAMTERISCWQRLREDGHW